MLFTNDLQGALVAFIYANVFRVYHQQLKGKDQTLMKYGLSIGSQDRQHRAVMRLPSPNISFVDVYNALALDGMYSEPRPLRSMRTQSAFSITYKSSRMACITMDCSNRSRSETINTLPYVDARRRNGR